MRVYIKKQTDDEYDQEDVEYDNTPSTVEKTIIDFIGTLNHDMSALIEIIKFNKLLDKLI